MLTSGDKVTPKGQRLHKKAGYLPSLCLLLHLYLEELKGSQIEYVETCILGWPGLYDAAPGCFESSMLQVAGCPA